MEYKLDDAADLMDTLYASRTEISRLKKEEEYCKTHIIKIMNDNDTYRLRSGNLVCTLTERSQRQISKDIPVEIVEPYYITKNYHVLNVSKIPSQQH